MEVKIAIVMLVLLVAMTTVFAGGAKESGAAGKLTVGLCMPTQSSERWINDAANMKKQLEALGYKVDVQFAEDDVQAQVSL